MTIFPPISVQQVREPRSFAIEGFERFVEGPWRDKFAATYVDRTKPNESFRCVGLFRIDGTQLARRRLPEGWTVAWYGADGTPQPFRLEDDSSKQDPVGFLGWPVFSARTKFFLFRRILAICEDGRVAAIGDSEPETLVAASRRGALAALDVSKRGPTLLVSEAPPVWKSVKVVAERKVQVFWLALGMAFDGKAGYFLSRQDRKDDGKVQEGMPYERSKYELLRCDATTGRCRDIATFLVDDRIPSGADVSPKRNQLSCMPDGSILVFLNGRVSRVTIDDVLQGRS